MQMDAGLDTGDILLTRKTSIDPSDTAGDLADKLVALGIEGLIEVIEHIKAGSLQPQAQPDGHTYAKKIQKQEARIDWNRPAHTIVNQVHAFNPDPICFTFCPHQDREIRLKLYSCKAIEQPHRATPGEIVDVSTEGVTVAAGTGQVIITRLQLPLGKGSVLTGRDVQNSRTDILFSGVRLQ
jgi:methionyl-tRNA formyltransferase